MIGKALIEGLKSMVVRSLTSPLETSEIAPLSMVFTGGVAGITLILAEVFFGLFIYKALHFEYGYREGLSMLVASLGYIVQAAIATLMIKHRLKKMAKENVVVKEYKLLKNLINALIDGYKGK